jgi:hypothetical protein
MTAPFALAWHITKKDLRALRWLIALFVTLTVLQAVLRVIWPPMIDTTFPMSYVEWLEPARTLLPFIRGLLFTEIVVLLVQADPLVTTDAFWLTRPISPRVLFFSKLLTTALALIVPTCLTQVVLMFSFDVPAVEIVRVIPEILLYTTVGMAAVLIGAALTANQRELVAWAAGLFVLTIVVMALIFNLVDYDPQSVRSPLATRALMSVGLSRADVQIVEEVVFTAAFIGAAWHLYRTRRRGRAASIAAIATVAAFYLTVNWSPSPMLSKPRERPVATGIPLSPALRVNDGPRALSARPIDEDSSACHAMVTVTRVQGQRRERGPMLVYGFVHRPTGEALSSTEQPLDRLSYEMAPLRQFYGSENTEAFQILYRHVWIRSPKDAMDGSAPQPPITRVSCRDVDVWVKWQAVWPDDM